MGYSIIFFESTKHHVDNLNVADLILLYQTCEGTFLLLSASVCDDYKSQQYTSPLL